MRLNQIPPLPDAQHLLDTAFQRARKKEKSTRWKHKDRVVRYKKDTLLKVDVVHSELVKRLRKIVKSFPNFDDLTEFYEELIFTFMDYDKLKESLGSIDWAATQIDKLASQARNRLRNADSWNQISGIRKSFYGRVSSIVDQIDDKLHFLNQSRKEFRDFPSIRHEDFTICLAGFPNAGKTTLLNRLAETDAEVKAYAFTTKRLNVGYADLGTHNVQVVDTPGTLNRDKMNNIERVAHLALRYESDLIVYLFDPSKQYPVEDQLSLYENMSRYRSPVIPFIAKGDAFDVEEFREEYGVEDAVTSYEELVSELEGFVN